MKRHTLALLGSALLAGITCGCAPVPPAEDGALPGVDVAAARSLAMRNNCLRCHGLSKHKEGPTYAEVAAEYRGKPGAEDRLYEHLTSGKGKVMPDGHVEHHKTISDRKPEEIRNLVRWVLAQ
jgi:cytochrome c